MARKTTKTKSRAKKATRKKARKGAVTASRRRAPARKAAASAQPRRVATGKGPGPAEVAQAVTALVRAGRAGEVEERWLAPSVESVEGVGMALAWKGKKSVLGKYRAWEADHEVHESRVDGPWVGATGFALRYAIDVTQKSTGRRAPMEEIAVYTVRDGKIVREEFHYKVG